MSWMVSQTDKSRIPFGGAQASELMLKLAQLKYPSFPLKVTNSQATFMYHETCYFSSNYEEELRSLEDPAKMAGITKVVQFPYTQPVRLATVQAADHQGCRGKDG